MKAAYRRLHEQVLERDNHRCQDCGTHADTVHHIISRRYIGAWDERNMITLCMWCHQGKDQQSGAHTRDARKHHLQYLRDTYGYSYDDMGELWNVIKGS